MAEKGPVYKVGDHVMVKATGKIHMMDFGRVAEIGDTKLTVNTVCCTIVPKPDGFYHYTPVWNEILGTVQCSPSRVKPFDWDNVYKMSMAKKVVKKKKKVVKEKVGV
jgi:hypothetical protein